MSRPSPGSSSEPNRLTCYVDSVDDRAGVIDVVLILEPEVKDASGRKARVGRRVRRGFALRVRAYD